ncbi:MAG: phosphoglycerate dehydrogenase [Salinicola sp.]|uniref:phosphoglycerate dehydrogenase n=1 Tax=Salinicola sp. TaxID=1978524 RepID=UPI001DAC03E2|nr:phosphoglycerate dehydrogenase [Salinicola sp.]NRB54488.1 phosphoglycerate dehydrogenase [Salinicola sp.]
MKIVCTSPSFARYSRAPIESLEARDIELVALPADIDETTFIERADGAVGAIVAFNAISDRVLGALPAMKIVAKHGVGVDNIDLAAAARHGVTITNVPAANREAVADFTFALLMASARAIPRVDTATKRGEWPRHFGRDVHGATLGIVGLGSIGQAVARRAAGFDMTLVAHDPFADADVASALSVELMPLDELCRRADYLTLHVGLSEQTRHLIDAARLGSMKPTAVLINAARGGIVDESALYDALTQGTIAAAAVDAFEIEPASEHPLFALDNVIATSHVAGYTENALTTLSQSCVDDVIAVIDGRAPRHPVSA